MPQVVIENPIINSPFDEPTRHFRFSDEGITNEIVDGRRTSSYFVPIAKPKKKGAKQLQFDTEWTQDRIEENKLVNDIRRRVALWRKGGYVGVTPTTARLIAYWTDPDREKKLFFCQIEALETAIYITEVAQEIRRRLDRERAPRGQRHVEPRPAAHGLQDGHRLRQDRRHGHAHRLAHAQQARQPAGRPLLRHLPDRHARHHHPRPAARAAAERPGQLLPPARHRSGPDCTDQLGTGQNPHHQLPCLPAAREGRRRQAHRSRFLPMDEPSPFTETPDQMVRRVCRELGTKKNIIVLNDEAHHCYRRKPDGEEETLTGDDRNEAKKREEEARVWISGIEAVKAKIGVKAIYDLSATPFFLRGSGYPEGTLFPWVVSDFSLIDAIEAGIVKVPRVPVADDSMTGEQPTYRDLWLRIREDLPKKGRKTDEVRRRTEAPRRTARRSAQPLRQLRKVLPPVGTERRSPRTGITPPVFIVVCNNTNVSKLVFDYIAGWEKQIGEERRRPGRATADFPQRRRPRRLAAPPQHHPGGQPAARVRRDR